MQNEPTLPNRTDAGRPHGFAARRPRGESKQALPAFSFAA